MDGNKKMCIKELPKLLAIFQSSYLHLVLQQIQESPCTELNRFLAITQTLDQPKYLMNKTRITAELRQSKHQQPYQSHKILSKNSQTSFQFPRLGHSSSMNMKQLRNTEASTSKQFAKLSNQLKKEAILKNQHSFITDFYIYLLLLMQL